MSEIVTCCICEADKSKPEEAHFSGCSFSASHICYNCEDENDLKDVGVVCGYCDYVCRKQMGMSPPYGEKYKLWEEGKWPK